MKILITCRLWKTEGGRTDNHIKYELDSELSRCGFFLIHNSQLACGKYLSRMPLLIGIAPVTLEEATRRLKTRWCFSSAKK
jgi:hypothetical protein